MKTVFSSNARPLHCALCAVLLGLAALWALPTSARAQLYVDQTSPDFTGIVGEYDATTGAAINANLVTGLEKSAGLAVAPVPEASSWWMMAGGGAALLAVMLRKKYRSA